MKQYMPLVIGAAAALTLVYLISAPERYRTYMDRSVAAEQKAYEVQRLHKNFAEGLEKILSNF